MVVRKRSMVRILKTRKSCKHYKNLTMSLCVTVEHGSIPCIEMLVPWETHIGATNLGGHTMHLPKISA